MDFTNAIGKQLTTFQSQIRKNMVKYDVNASGRTSKSIEVLADDSSGLLVASKVMVNTEKGVAPSARGKYNGFYAIREWAGIKLGVTNTAIIARITWNIKDFGTLLFQRGGRTTIYTDLITNPTNYKPMENEISTQILSEINNIFKQ